MTTNTASAPLVSTDDAAEAVRRTPEALGWDAARGRVTLPVLIDGVPRWDLDVLRADLGAYRRRARRAHPRWPRDTQEWMMREHAKDVRRRDALAASVVTDRLDDGHIDVSDGFGREIGSVRRGDTLTRTDVWLIQPLSRKAHADTWDLPWALTAGEAIDRLARGDYVL